MFPAPLRSMLEAGDHAAACAIGRARSGKGISLQAWHLMAKVRELDALLASGCLDETIEVHPEVSFCGMNGGQPLEHRKKTASGKEERRILLEQHLGPWSEPVPLPGAARDDILDALVALWTAGRHARGVSVAVTDQAERDSRGLPMQIRW